MLMKNDEEEQIIMLQVNENEKIAVNKIFELRSRGFNSEEISCVLNDRNVISGIICRIEMLSDKMLNYDIDIDKELDYKNILQSRDKDAIEELLSKFREYKKYLDIKEIDFIIAEARKLYMEEPEEIIDTIEMKKHRDNNIPFGYEEVIDITE